MAVFSIVRGGGIGARWHYVRGRVLERQKFTLYLLMSLRISVKKITKIAFVAEAPPRTPYIGSLYRDRHTPYNGVLVTPLLNN